MQVFEKKPLKISAISEPELDHHFIYITLNIDTKKNPKLLKPGVKPGGEYVIKYKERIEPGEKEADEQEGTILLVDGDLSWAKRMGTYEVKDKSDPSGTFKERRLSDLGAELEEHEINKKIRLYITDVYNLWDKSKKS